MSFVIKRKKTYKIGKTSWFFLCDGKTQKYSFLPMGNWESKYLVKEIKNYQEAYKIVQECKEMFKMPAYEYSIEEYVTK